MQAVEKSSVERYVASRLGFSFAMKARGAFRIVGGSASQLIVRPVAVMAARVLGPGSTRLKLVKLAHNLGNTATGDQLPRDHDAGPIAPSEPTRHAA